MHCEQDDKLDADSLQDNGSFKQQEQAICPNQIYAFFSHQPRKGVQAKKRMR